MLTIEELRAAAQDGTIDSVAVCTPDLQGKLMGKRVPVASFLEHPAIEVSCSIFVYDNEQNVHEGFPEIGARNGWADTEARADLATLRRAAHIDRSAICLADLWWSAERPVEISPRRILRTQVERAVADGLVPVAAVETEFYLFGETYEQCRERGYRGLRPLHATAQDYGLSRANRDEDFLGDLRRTLAASGLPVDSVKTEIGPAQYEVTLCSANALEAADRIALAKLVTREVAAKHGRAATFMARLDHVNAGNSGHLHLSFADPDGRNLFDLDGSALSDLGRHAIGGIMARAPELMLLVCPYVNSYKRLDPANFVTASLDWGFEGRTVPLRVVGHGPSRNFEYRICGADANFYLALAGLVAAALDGIAGATEPFHPGSVEAAAVGDLPDDLRDAIDRWAGSAWARATFGDLVVDTIAVAARHELAAHAREVSDIELRRGFEWV